jgi:hypothetical protein
MTNPAPADPATAPAPAQEPTASSWDDLFQGEDPSKVKKALEESRRWEQRAKENKLAAEKLAALEESQKTEAQKLADRAEAAEKRAAEVELSQMRLRVALRHGIDESDVDRLRGSTEEELNADAKSFAERLKKTMRPAGPVDQGPRGAAPAQNPRDAFAELISKQLGQ